VRARQSTELSRPPSGIGATVGPVRQAARTVVLDRSGAILLVQYGDGRPGHPAHYWATPGGAVEPGETHRNAARRELLEETGLDAEVGRELWSRRVLLDLPAGMTEQHETYFLVRVSEVTPIVRNTSTEAIVEHRWWSLSELRTTTDVVFPDGLLASLAEAGMALG
jgi:8-oxo-dGTP pyrophosphatase MutT (NUDIX family)